MSFGFVLVYSATVTHDLVWYDSRWFRQIIYFVGGCVLPQSFSLVKNRLLAEARLSAICPDDIPGSRSSRSAAVIPRKGRTLDKSGLY